MSLDLNKKKVLELKKSRGIEWQLAQVVFVVDYSGSMSNLYRSGAVQKVLERLFPVAMAFDDNQSMDFILFTNDYHVCPEVTPKNVTGYVENVAMKEWYSMGCTSYSPALREVILPMVASSRKEKSSEQKVVKSGWFFGFFEKTEVVNKSTTTTVTDPKKLDTPVYVIFLTDGDCDDKSETYQVVRELSNAGAFIQFIGIGNEEFKTLQKLDDLNGRLLDNADFFAINDINSISDDDLYAKLMNEFPSWVGQARKAGLIK